MKQETVIIKDPILGERKIVKGYRSWYEHCGKMPPHSRFNGNGDLVQKDANGVESVLLSADEINANEGKSVMQILEAKAKEQGAMA